MSCFVSIIVSAPGCIPHSCHIYSITKRSELMQLLRTELHYQSFPMGAIVDFDIRECWPAIRKGYTWSRDSYHGNNQMTAHTVTPDEYRAWSIQELDEDPIDDFPRGMFEEALDDG